jgi:hypothetical protein
MKIKCPACGAPVPAENINIQTMSAVCTECDNVFRFEAYTDHSPQRKVKPPTQITFYEDAPLHFAFKWDWRTEPLIGLILMIVGLVALILTLPLWVNDAELLLVIIPLAAFLVYTLLAISMNRTHYQIKNDALSVYTTPLWFPYYGSKVLTRDLITHFSTERILDSPTVSGADTFYNVFAHTTDNRRVLIARAVNSQHAHFIAQELQAYLDQPSEAEQDALFTSEDDAETDDLTFDTDIGAHRAQR